MQEITQEIINAVRELFIVRDDCYPQQVEGANEYKVIKQRFSDEIIKKHLQGLITVGSFQIDPETNQVKWLCFDFDGELERELEKARNLYNRLIEKGYNPLLEFSGRRGYHIWLFINPIDASVAKKFSHEIAKDIEVSDIYPKQEKIEQTGFGGQVKIPIGIHRVSNKRSLLFKQDIMLDKEMSLDLLLEINRQNRDRITISNLIDFSK